MRVFISYKHTDYKYINNINSVRLNSNHNLNFDDRSLQDPVFNQQGHINRRTPSDAVSKPVRDKIEYALRRTDKLILLIGNDTHSSEWVQWEFDTFLKLKGIKNVYIMETPNNTRGGLPKNTPADVNTHSWNLKNLATWLTT